MKKALLVLSLAVVSMVFASCYQKERDEALKANDSLMALLDAKDSELDSMFETLNQIEDNLNAVNAKYNNVQELKRNATEGSYNVRNQISAQISSIEGMLAANKQKLNALNAKVSTSGKENKRLQEYVTKLEERVSAQEAQIAELLTELENNKITIKKLNQDVSDLTASNKEKDQYIALQAAEANRAYYVVGSYTELKAAGVVSKVGGFIGIGRRQGTVADMATELFTEIDRTKVNTIPVNKRRALVISKHPETSYELVMDDNDPSTVAYLRILNPAKFWEQTRYLVISTR